MNWDLDDTIAALASPAGAAARATIRISGPQVTSVVKTVFSSTSSSFDKASAGKLPSCLRGEVRLPDLPHPIPAHLYLWPTTRSYTGQTAAELHMLGSPPLVEALLLQLTAAGARLARPGEFTLRSFLAGHIDLVQAEAVLGVIDAVDHAELQTALQQLAGGLSNQVQRLREDLVNLLSDLEAGLDFVEEDIEFVSAEEIKTRLTNASLLLQTLMSQSTDRMQSTGRLRVLLAGLPNAGKSTLLNHLAGDSRALVSPVSGTTRDYLTTSLEWDGLTIELIDTAGWELLHDEADVMNYAQQLRADQIEQSDLVVWCTASDLSADEKTRDAQLQQQLTDQGISLFNTTTKCDLNPPDAAGNSSAQISCQTETGIPEFKSAVVERLSASQGKNRQIVGSTAARCGESLAGAHAAIERALEAADVQAGDEIVALELRDALNSLGQIVGLVYTDDLLDRIFSKFCIGK